MEGIKVGEYVRTKNGFIVKIIGKYDEMDYYILEKDIINCYGSIINYADKSEIVKHVFNIIDLIEIGDYVNGELVIDIIPILDEGLNQIGRKLLTQYRVAQYKGTVRNYYILEEDIKTIVTKEQFKNIEYKVED